MKSPVNLVPNWRRLWKSAVVLVAVIGAALPEILQLLADSVASFPVLDDGWKALIRFWALVLVVVVRFWHQPGLRDPKHPDPQQPGPPEGN